MWVIHVWVMHVCVCNCVCGEGGVRVGVWTDGGKRTPHTITTSFTFRI